MEVHLQELEVDPSVDMNEAVRSSLRQESGDRGDGLGQFPCIGRYRQQEERRHSALSTKPPALYTDAGIVRLGNREPKVYLPACETPGGQKGGHVLRKLCGWC